MAKYVAEFAMGVDFRIVQTVCLGEPRVGVGYSIAGEFHVTFLVLRVDRIGKEIANEGTSTAGHFLRAALRVLSAFYAQLRHFVALPRGFLALLFFLLVERQCMGEEIVSV